MEEIQKLVGTTLATKALAELVAQGVLEWMAAHGAEVSGESVSSADIADALGLNKEALFRTMQFVASKGLLEHTAYGKFRLAPGASEAASKNGPGRMFLEIMGSDRGHWLPMLHLDRVLQSGRAGEGAWEGLDSCWSWYEQHDTERRRFAQFMSGLTELFRPFIVSAYDYSAYTRHCDLGGSEGVISKMLQEKYPELHSISYDLPEITESHVHETTERLKFQGGSFFESVPPAQVYTMKYILHDWKDDECEEILRNCAAALEPNGRVVVYDVVMPEYGEDPTSSSYQMDFLMMVVPCGRERTRSELAEIAHRSGFEIESVTIMPGSRFGCSVLKLLTTENH